MITTYAELWKYRGTIKSIFSAKLPAEVAAKLSPHQHIFYALIDYNQRRDAVMNDLGLRQEKDAERQKELQEQFNSEVSKMGGEEVEFTAAPLAISDLAGANFSVMEVAAMQDFGVLHAG